MIVANCLVIETGIHFKLLRLNKWVIASFFMLLNACLGFTYESIEAGVVSSCVACFLFMLFLTYKSPDNVKATYYGYLALGIASLIFLPILFFVPPLWLIGLLLLQSLSLRSWLASLLGILTPYWLAFPWFLYQQSQEVSAIHFPLFQLDGMASGNSPFMPVQLIVLGMIIVLTLIGAFNFWSKSYQENIQTRLFFNCFQWMGLAVVIAILLLPQHFHTLIRMLLLFACPFIAHFFALSRSKIINIVFFITMVFIVVLSLISAHHHSLLNEANETLYQLWNG